jgi:hypothetical protein
MDGHIYIEVHKCMCGLPESGILANQLQAQLLAVHGYHHTNFTPGIWEHVTFPIKFTLVADDFVVQYVVGEHANHHINAMEQSYTVYKYWLGSLYCGITLNWGE